MQTLQCFTTSVLNDGANLQKLRDQLQELPRKLLQGNQQPEDYLLGTVSGECNYHFTFRLEGGGFFQTGVLVASAENFPGGLPVPLKCKWKRRVGDLMVEIRGPAGELTSNMYQISADDVGTDICVEAQPADHDDGLYGVVVGEIGPFELDPATRRSLDNALGLGGSKFNVMQSRVPGDGTPPSTRQDLAILVSTNDVRVQLQTSQGSREPRELAATEYSADYPRVIIHPLDTTKFELQMGDSRTFHLAAVSRTSRDLIALTIRCFHARKYLSTASILEALLPVQPLVPGAGAGPGAGPPAIADGRLDACILLERLAKELNRSMQQKEVSEKVLRNTNHEKKQLQAQLMETIHGFTEVIEGLQDQFAADGGGGALSSMGGPSMSVDRLQDQMRELNHQNQGLQAELQSMRQRFERLQVARKTAEARGAGQGGAGPLPAEQLQRLKEERDLLQARLAEVSSSSHTSQQRDQADQVHTQELKRLRQDVEALHNQKEQLRRQLQEQDKERQELQENFLYVKGQLDKVQMKQASAAADSVDGCSKELQRHRQTLNNVSEERNRLSMRLESVLREVEKEKAYHEQSLERVMTANARLMEEKDRASVEVQRLSKLYSESVSQMQSDMGNLGSTSGLYRNDDLGGTVSGGPPVDEAELARLREHIAKCDDALKRKEQENESLKNRIRKLAVA